MKPLYKSPLEFMLEATERMGQPYMRREQSSDMERNGGA